MTKLYFFIAFFSVNLLSFGQSTSVSIDSLNTYLNDAYIYGEKSDYLNAIVSGKKLLELSYKQNDSSYIAEAYYVLAYIDEVIEEPLGGSHRNPDQAALLLKKSIIKNLDDLKAHPINSLIQKRFDRLMSYGKK